MAKGMSLDEFKNALASEATIENEKLKNELETLKGKSSTKINELQLKVNQYKEWHKQLCNRCYVQTQGVLCISCGIECEYGYTYDDFEAASNYMRKNKLPRTPDTYEKVNEFLKKRRNKRQ